MSRRWRRPQVKGLVLGGERGGGGGVTGIGKKKGVLHAYSSLDVRTRWWYRERSCVGETVRPI